MASAEFSGDQACLQCSFKIGKVVSDVTLTQAKLSWIKKGGAANKSGMENIVFSRKTCVTNSFNCNEWI